MWRLQPSRVPAEERTNLLASAMQHLVALAVRADVSSETHRQFCKRFGYPPTRLSLLLNGHMPMTQRDLASLTAYGHGKTLPKRKPTHDYLRRLAQRIDAQQRLQSMSGTQASELREIEEFMSALAPTPQVAVVPPDDDLLLDRAHQALYDEVRAAVNALARRHDLPEPREVHLGVGLSEVVEVNGDLLDDAAVLNVSLPPAWLDEEQDVSQAAATAETLVLGTSRNDQTGAQTSIVLDLVESPRNTAETPKDLRDWHFTTRVIAT